LPRMTLTSRLISGAHRFGGSVFRISLGQHLARLAPVVTSFGEMLAAGLAPIAGEDTAILTMNRNARIPKKVSGHFAARFINCGPVHKTTDALPTFEPNTGESRQTTL
jgi:hypothetical protein